MLLLCQHGVLVVDVLCVAGGIFMWMEDFLIVLWSMVEWTYCDAVVSA